MNCVLCSEEIPSAWPHMLTAHKIARPDGLIDRKIRKSPTPRSRTYERVQKVVPVIEDDGGCAHTASQVYDSRKQPGGTVWRRRRCLHCQERFTTMEVIVR